MQHEKMDSSKAETFDVTDNLQICHKPEATCELQAAWRDELSWCTSNFNSDAPNNAASSV